MQRGRAQVVSVVGEAGAGKSRLLAEFLRGSRRDGRLGRHGRAPHRLLVAGRADLRHLRRAVPRGLPCRPRRLAGSGAAEAAAGLQSAGRRRGGGRGGRAGAELPARHPGGAPRDIEPEQLQRQITLAARALLERRLAQQPLMFVVDDLHWADAASVDLLREVADQLADRSLMLLVSQRPDAPAAGGAGRAADHHLVPLSADETGRWWTACSARWPATPSPGARIRRARAGGNPLFVEEIVRSLVGRGVLVREGGRWTCARACETWRSAHTVRPAAVARRPAAREDRRMLQEAAVLGGAFDGALLRPSPSAGRRGALDRLVEAD